MKTLMTKTMKETVVLACLVLACLAGLSYAQPETPPLAEAPVPAAPAPAAPQNLRIVPAPEPEPALALSVTSLAGPHGMPGPDLPATNLALDEVITNVQASIVRRRSTNWFAGSIRSGTAHVALMGIEVPIPIYAQEGRLLESTRANFQVDGEWTGCDLTNRTVAVLFRTFAADGTNYFFFPDITSDSLP